MKMTTDSPFISLRHTAFEKGIQDAWMHADKRHSGAGGFTSRWPPVARRVDDPRPIVQEILF